MRKTVYYICVCVLVILVVCESRNGLKSSDQSVDTALLAEGQRGVSVGAVQTEKRAEKKVAYLSFDDGPSQNTEKILQILKEKHAVATFFLIGKEITKERESIVQRAVNQGNAVGVHTYCHEAAVMYSDEQAFFEDYEKAAKAVRTATGEIPKLYRFPWGSNNKFVGYYVDKLHENLMQMGVKCFDWNVSGEDSVGRNISSEVIFNNVKKDLNKYSTPIILLHDSSEMKNTAEVLDDIIDYIYSQGYTFDTLENREEYMFPASWR